jgi:N-acylglucosamine-6-phosphate 2-epimerase
VSAAEVIQRLRGSLIVSVQTSPSNPLRGAEHVELLARAAVLGGATCVRADTPEHVSRAAAAQPSVLMGIYTRALPGYDVRITPTFESARQLVEAGANIVSIDGTGRQRPGSETLFSLVTRIHEELGVPVMADVPSVADGVAARAAGADVVGSSVEGYERARADDGPDIALVGALVDALDCPVIAERGYWTVEHARAAMAAGAHAVVIGTAIVDPTAITRRFADAIALSARASAR